MAIRRKKNGNGARNVEARLAALRQDFDALQDDMKGLAVGAGEVASEHVNGLVRATEDAAGQAFEDAGEWANGNVNSLRDVVRDQPFASCMLSLGAGALVGALFLRR